MEWLQSEEPTKKPTCAKGPVIKVELDDDLEEAVGESSSETEDAHPNAFKFAKCTRDNGASGSRDN